MAKISFQVRVDQTGNNSFGGGGYWAFAGVAGATFQIENPFNVDIAGTGPGVAESDWWEARVGTNCLGWGYPTRPTGGPFLNALGDVVEFAVDTGDRLLWRRDVTADPTGWSGNGVPPGPDPATADLGTDFSALGGSPITGDIYITLGVRWDSGKPKPSITLLGGSDFDGTPPSGFHVIPASITLNPDDASVYIALSNGNKTVEPIAGIPGSYTAFVRSNVPLGIAFISGDQLLPAVTQTARIMPLTQRAAVSTAGSIVGVKFDLFDGAAIQTLRLSNAGAAIATQ